VWGDPPVLIGDAVRARALQGWQQARSELAMQIEGAWRCMQPREQLEAAVALCGVGEECDCCGNRESELSLLV
jgi:hypothetical protein